MLSSIFSSTGKVTTTVLVIFIFMYALNILSSLKESLQGLQYFSFFYYFDFSLALVDGKLDPLGVGMFLGLGMIMSLIGLVMFIKRDIVT